MINILAQADIKNMTWAFSNDLPIDKTMSQMVLDGMGEMSINVGFIDDELPVEFDGMSCTLVVTVNEEEICNIEYPNVPIERTDLPYCFSHVFRALPDDNIIINVSVTNAGKTWSSSLNIIIDPLPIITESGELVDGPQEAQA